MTREEVLAGLLECYKKLGRTPTYAELKKMSKLTRFWIQKHFANMGHAFREAGVDALGSGFRIETSVLLDDWAQVARKLGHLPSLGEYKREGKFSTQPFMVRCRIWSKVPDGFRAFVQKCEREAEWADVLAMITKRDEYAAAPIVFRSPATDPLAGDEPRSRRRIRFDRPIYGPPSLVPGMRYEPVNEQGVVYVFGMMAERIRFEVERIQSEFPDCEAMREVEAGKWQRVKIEFEYASKNFQEHKHPLDGCDVIVCWIHNWPECPETIEVIELKKIVRAMWRGNCQEHQNE